MLSLDLLLPREQAHANLRHSETIKRVLSLPADTNIIWKSHDDSIAQRSAIDEARQQGKTHHTNRRVTLSADDSPAAKDKDKAQS